MEQLLLWIDAGLNLLMGGLLGAFPRRLIAALGLPEARPELYARVLGSVLVGIGLALAIEAGLGGGAGLGLDGAVAINLCGAAMLGALLLGSGMPLARRGRLLLWGLVAALIGLSAVEVAVIRSGA